MEALLIILFNLNKCMMVCHYILHTGNNITIKVRSCQLVMISLKLIFYDKVPD